MKRIVALTGLLLFVGAVPAFAQASQDPANAPTAPAVSGSPAGTLDAGTPNASPAPRLFSRASIEKAVATAATPATPQTKKPFFKTPWPYVIGGAIVLILILTLGGSSSPGNGIY